MCLLLLFCKPFSRQEQELVWHESYLSTDIRWVVYENIAKKSYIFVNLCQKLQGGDYNTGRFLDRVML